MEKREYPSRAEDYELYEMIGDGGSAVVHRARCVPFDEIVAIKILDIEKNSDLTNICHEAQTMKKINHRNVLKSHCSFVNDHDLWVVMPYMAGGSCLHIMKSAYPNGFEEVIIATILREVLKGLEYLHENGNIHRDIKAGNILIDSHGGVKLGDFGVSASLFDSGDRQRRRNTFVGTPCWMAPEVMEQVHGYDFKADIWSFGITALELAHGHAPFSSQPPVKVLLMTLQNAPPSLESSKDKKFSKSFKHMIATCLVKDPSKRPTAHKLLKQPFFKQAKSDEYIEKKILVGLPALEDRFHILKTTEAELLADKKMLDVEKEALSQNEYKRGISNWNFDIDVIKAQAALMPDTEDVVSDKSLSFSGELEVLHESSPTSCVKKDQFLEETNGIQTVRDSHSSLDHSPKSRIPQSEDHENEYYTCGNSSNQSSIHENGFKTYMNPSSESKTDEWHVKHNVLVSYDNHSTSTSSCSLDSLQSFKQESLKQHNKVENMENDMPHGTTEMPGEPMVKISKPTALNCDDGDEKSRPTVVQQKGRFKVTSENVDKAHSNRSQSTSHSEQLETAEEKEKRLIQEIADLQKRLLLSEEELRRTREKISQLKNASIKLDS